MGFLDSDEFVGFQRVTSRVTCCNDDCTDSQSTDCM